MHEPFPKTLSVDVITYMKDKRQIISEKNKQGKPKTAEEKFVEVMVNYSGSNEKKYYEKCD